MPLPRPFIVPGHAPVRVHPATVALAVLLHVAPLARADAPATPCASNAPAREVQVRVDELPATVSRIGLHEDFVALRTESRLTAAGLSPRPPAVRGCRYLQVSITTPSAPGEVVVLVRPLGGAGGVAAEFEARESLTLTQDPSLAARRGEIERILAAVARQVDAFARAARLAGAVSADAPRE